MSRRNLYWLLGIPAVSLLGLTVSYRAARREKDKDYEMVRLLVDVLRRGGRNATSWRWTPSAKRKLVEDMINGGLERLDPHSAYMTPQRIQAIRQAEQGQVRRRRHPGPASTARRGSRPSSARWSARPLTRPASWRAISSSRSTAKSTENMRLSEAVDLIQGDRARSDVDRAARRRQGAGRSGNHSRRHRRAERAGRPPQDRQAGGMGLHAR